MKHPVTSDGRYFLVNGRLWRMASPHMDEQERQSLVFDLMTARRDVAKANRTKDEEARADARRRVHAAKLALGERGPVWWTDGAPDFGRHLAKNTPYADWAREQTEAADSDQPAC